MSKRYPGGIITKSPATPTGPYESGTAPGVWTLEQQMQFNQQGIWPTAGLLPNYIEDVFSTYLYTGTGATQTITNGIDLSTKGGLVWAKIRSGFNAPLSHALFDTSRGVLNRLASNTTDAQVSTANSLTAFNSTGFTVGSSVTVNGGGAGDSYVSWTFRDQAKFFDVVTYTGNGTAGRTVAHNLGSVPGCIIVKPYSVDTGDYWGVYHRSLGATKAIFLSATNAAATASTYWNNTEPTSTNFTVGDWSGVNQNGTSYVAYIFAHDAGGFGLTGTDNVISCGTYTTDGSGNATVNLGYEPQWLLRKRSDAVSDWVLVDNMRGWATGDTNTLAANEASQEFGGGFANQITSTGFSVTSDGASRGYIYIAIRRGPMKVPTVGTSVFSPIAYVGANGAAQNISAGFPVDMDIIKIRNDASRNPLNHARLMGGVFLSTNATGAQQSYSDNIVSFNNAQNVIGLPVTGGGTNEINGASTSTYIGWAMRRAPSFMDVVCYTGTGASATFNHNLTVTPEIIITKNRSNVDDWGFWHKNLYPTYASSAILFLNGTGTAGAGYMGTPTSSTFAVITGNAVVNASGNTYVAYLFATCAGVSKVGSYTGNGTTQTIDCGFTGGARFVLIRRIDTSGDWYVYDTARGMSVLTDPYLLLNTTAAEVATLGSVTTVSTGFALNSAILAAINISAGTYIFLAIA